VKKEKRWGGSNTNPNLYRKEGRKEVGIPTPFIADLIEIGKGIDLRKGRMD